MPLAQAGEEDAQGKNEEEGRDEARTVERGRLHRSVALTAP